MKSICVYLGAAIGNNPLIQETVITLAKQIAESNCQLIYGASSQGLMGLLAKTVLSNGGKVTGIITKHLIPIERPLETLQELIVTESMQERKLMMQRHSDAFIVVPGGLGTLEEAFETWDAIKIGLMDKPIGFLNVNGFFDGLFQFIDTCVSQGFILPHQANIPIVSAKPKQLVNDLLKACDKLEIETVF